MKEIEKQKSEQFARIYVNKLIRQWRALLYIHCSGNFEKFPTDVELARSVGITPAAFSRISSSVTTCSYPVLIRIYMCMRDTLGESDFMKIKSSSFDFAYDKVYGNA